MNTTRWSQIGIIVLCNWISKPVAQQLSNSPAALNTVKTEQLTGIKEKLDIAESVFKTSQPRTNLSVALDNDLEVTGLHNHFLREKPRIMFMYIGGIGNLKMSATSINKVFAKSQERYSSKNPAATIKFDAVNTSLDSKPIKKIGEVYKLTLGRTTQRIGHRADVPENWFMFRSARSCRT